MDELIREVERNIRNSKGILKTVENRAVYQKNDVAYCREKKMQLEFYEGVYKELEYAKGCHELEEQLGCPLKVLYEIKKDKQIYIDTYIVQKPSGVNTSIVKGMYTVMGIDILKNQIQCLAQFSECYMEFYVPIYEYKADWFLREDKSE